MGADTVLLSFAGHRVRVAPEPGVRLGPLDPLYAPFTRPDDGAPADTAITVSAREAALEPGLEVRFDTGDAWRLLARGSRRAIVLQPPGRTAPLWVATADAGYARVVVHCGAPLLDRADRLLTARRVIQYPLDQIVVVNALARRGGLLVHAAGVIRNGVAVLFAGRSGAGKSTISRLLGDPGGLSLLSDDRILLRMRGGGIEAFGSPWPGEAGVASAATAPLGALCFLIRGSGSGVEALSARDALPRLLEVASVPWYEPDAATAALDTGDRLLRAVPAFALHFDATRRGVTRALDALDRAA